MSRCAPTPATVRVPRSRFPVVIDEIAMVAGDELADIVHALDSGRLGTEQARRLRAYLRDEAAAQGMLSADKALDAGEAPARAYAIQRQAQRLADLLDQRISPAA